MRKGTQCTACIDRRLHPQKKKQRPGADRRAHPAEKEKKTTKRTVVFLVPRRDCRPLSRQLELWIISEMTSDGRASRVGRLPPFVRLFLLMRCFFLAPLEAAKGGAPCFSLVFSSTRRERSDKAKSHDGLRLAPCAISFSQCPG